MESTFLPPNPDQRGSTDLSSPVVLHPRLANVWEVRDTRTGVDGKQVTAKVRSFPIVAEQKVRHCPWG